MKIEPQISNLEGWLKPRGLRLVLLLGFILTLILAGAVIVHETGGTQYGYPHLLYIPILLASAIFHLVGGVVTGVIAGLSLVPVPRDVAQEIPQESSIWLFRTGFFVLVGLFSGLLFYWIRSQLEHIKSKTFFAEYTGLPNRDFFAQVFEQELKPANDPRGGLLIIEVLELETISRTLGYRYTQSLLKILAERLQECAEPEDFLVHLGPHQFLLARCYGGANELKSLAVEVRAATRNTLDLEGMPVYLETVVGIVRAGDCMDDTPVTVVQKGEEAAESARRVSSGVAFFQPESVNRVGDRIMLLGEFPEAMRRGELALHFQPQICLKSGKPRGVEALLRWEHPRRGRVPPGEFLGAVEQTTLIDEVTLWVVKEGLARIKQWRDSGCPLVLAVNVSPRTLHNPALVEAVGEALTTAQVAPGVLEVEVTESGVMAHPEAAIEVLGMLRDLGITVAIDDFGTGHSSLAYLKDLPTSVLKMDRSFVMDMLGRYQDREIMRKMIELAHSLDKVVVAEGVESAEVVRDLTGLGCDFVQGYHILPPVPAAELTSWVRQVVEAPGSTGPSQQPAP